jgi:hypothetical protein
MPGQWVVDEGQSLYFLEDEHCSLTPSHCEEQPLPQRPVTRNNSPKRLVRSPKAVTGKRKAPFIQHLQTPGGDESWPAVSLRTRCNNRPERDAQSLGPMDWTFAHPRTGLDLVMGYNTSLPSSRLDLYLTTLRQLVRCCSEEYLLT